MVFGLTKMSNKIKIKHFSTTILSYLKSTRKNNRSSVQEINSSSKESSKQSDKLISLHSKTKKITFNSKRLFLLLRMFLCFEE